MITVALFTDSDEILPIAVPLLATGPYHLQVWHFNEECTLECTLESTLRWCVRPESRRTEGKSAEFKRETRSRAEKDIFRHDLQHSRRDAEQADDTSRDGVSSA